MNQMKYLVPVFIILVTLSVYELRFVLADRFLLQNRVSPQTRRSEYRNASLWDNDFRRNKLMIRSDVRSTIKNSLHQERITDSKLGAFFSNPVLRHELLSNPKGELNIRSKLFRRIEDDIDKFFESPRNSALVVERNRADITRRYKNLNDHIDYDNFQSRSIENRKAIKEEARSRFSVNEDGREFSRDFHQRSFKPRKFVSASEIKSTLSNPRNSEKAISVFKLAHNYFQYCYEIISSKFDKVDKYAVTITIGIVLFDAVSVMTKEKSNSGKDKSILRSLMVSWSNNIN